MSEVYRIVRTASFSAAHRYYNPQLSDEENRKLYGAMYREQGFGHNFLLEAHIEGAIDPLSGMIVNLVEIDQWLNRVVMELDHQHLNELRFFKGQSPTPELIASHLFHRLAGEMKGHPSQAKLVKVRLYEGETLWVDVYPDSH